MITNDLNLYMKFQRQPRVLGTQCYYAPTNKLLVPPGIKPGAHVFICDFTQSGDDVYVTVCDMEFWAEVMTYPNNNPQYVQYKKDYIAKLPKDKKIMVVWKDLAQ